MIPNMAEIIEHPHRSDVYFSDDALSHMLPVRHDLLAMLVYMRFAAYLY